MSDLEFLTDQSFRPENGRVFWAKADDGIRLRVALWPEGTKGTVILFSGRNEYIEKYGPAAQEYAKCGYAAATIDWRGQGLSDRLLDEYLVGHVDEFADYQRDVRVLMDAVRDADLPKPWYLVAHSMGGAIGLRKIVEGHEFSAAVFSAPMWGLFMAPPLRPAAWAIAGSAKAIGLGAAPMLFSGEDNYVLNTKFSQNSLTNDREMWDFMGNTLRDNPDLGLGRPSCHWVHEALSECRHLFGKNDRNLPVWASLGADEEIVDSDAIRSTIDAWPGATMTEFNDCKHEIMMETPNLRRSFYDKSLALFSEHS